MIEGSLRVITSPMIDISVSPAPISSWRSAAILLRSRSIASSCLTRYTTIPVISAVAARIASVMNHHVFQKGGVMMISDRGAYPSLQTPSPLVPLTLNDVFTRTDIRVPGKTPVCRRWSIPGRVPRVCRSSDSCPV